MRSGQQNNLILVRGGGDIATGTIHRFHQCGFPVVVLEIPEPSAIRRKVSFSEAVYYNTAVVEGITCRRVEAIEEIYRVLDHGEIPLLVDIHGEIIAKLHPMAVIDAILAKKNLGTTRDMAPVTIGYGPGFTAPKDVLAVIETQRGHDLGRIYYEGSAAPNTGIPGLIGGYAKERVIHAETSGILNICVNIGDLVTAGQILGTIGNTKMIAVISGILRGILPNGYSVKKGMKIGDIDPRMEEQKNCGTISDKARCIAGSALEAYLHLRQTEEIHDLL